MRWLIFRWSRTLWKALSPWRCVCDTLRNRSPPMGCLLVITLTTYHQHHRRGTQPHTHLTHSHYHLCLSPPLPQHLAQLRRRSKIHAVWTEIWYKRFCFHPEMMNCNVHTDQQSNKSTYITVLEELPLFFTHSCINLSCHPLKMLLNVMPWNAYYI